MSLLQVEPDRNVHPVDIIEHIASINDWTFERQDADEISISVRGGWSDYHVSFNWMEDLESLHIACAFDLKVPEGRRGEIKQLISLINEQLWIGHFDIGPGRLERLPCLLQLDGRPGKPAYCQCLRSQGA